jgi:hypothetical protein
MYKIMIGPSGGRVIAKFVNGGILSFSDPSPGNTDYEEYLQWVAAGNTPEPPDPPRPPVDLGPSLEQRVEAAETIIDLLLMEGE